MLQRYTGLFKWTSSCAPPSLWSTRKKSMGNVLCASRARAPLLALSLDLLSFPAMMRAANVTLAAPPPAPSQQAHADAAEEAHRATQPGGDGLGAPAGTRKHKNLLSRRQSRDVFLQWGAFCSPWPACLSTPSGALTDRD